MSLPAFKEYSKNPIQYLLFVCVAVIGYLYIEGKDNCTERIDELTTEVVQLREDYKDLSEKMLEILEKTHQ